MTSLGKVRSNACELVGSIVTIFTSLLLDAEEVESDDDVVVDAVDDGVDAPDEGFSVGLFLVSLLEYLGHWGSLA